MSTRCFLSTMRHVVLVVLVVVYPELWLDYYLYYYYLYTSICLCRENHFNNNNNTCLCVCFVLNKIVVYYLIDLYVYLGTSSCMRRRLVRILIEYFVLYIRFVRILFCAKQMNS